MKNSQQIRLQRQEGIITSGQLAVVNSTSMFHRASWNVSKYSSPSTWLVKRNHPINEQNIISKTSRKMPAFAYIIIFISRRKPSRIDRMNSTNINGLINQHQYVTSCVTITIIFSINDINHKTKIVNERIFDVVVALVQLKRNTTSAASNQMHNISTACNGL